MTSPPTATLLVFVRHLNTGEVETVPLLRVSEHRVTLANGWQFRRHSTTERAAGTPYGPPSPWRLSRLQRHRVEHHVRRGLRWESPLAPAVQLDLDGLQWPAGGTT